jgi:hypothetical protein
MLARVFPSVPAPVTRRRVLVAVAGFPLLLSASACSEDAPVDLPADPDREALEAAHEVEAEALSSLAGWTPGSDDSGIAPAEARAVIGAHLAALAAALSSTPSATPSASESNELVPTLSTAQVVTVLDSAADDHTRALRDASPEISPLLASIAASDASLAAAIRRSS